ncbi:positive control sigma-like factor, partial [Bacillus amyloliquefaciens]
MRLIGVLFYFKKTEVHKMEDLLFEYKRALKNTKKLYRAY